MGENVLQYLIKTLKTPLWKFISNIFEILLKYKNILIIEIKNFFFISNFKSFETKMLEDILKSFMFSFHFINQDAIRHLKIIWNHDAIGTCFKEFNKQMPCTIK
jgi:hypothetical protein